MLLIVFFETGHNMAKYGRCLRIIHKNINVGKNMIY